MSDAWMRRVRICAVEDALRSEIDRYHNLVYMTPVHFEGRTVQVRAATETIRLLEDKLKQLRM